MDHHHLMGGDSAGDCHGGAGMHQGHHHAAAPMDPHSHHGHSHHHHHHDHGSSSMGMCSMNMYLNADVTDVCILHERWHATDARSFAGSLLLCALLVGLYERFAAWRRRYAGRAARQAKAAARKKELPSSSLSSEKDTAPACCTAESATDRSRRRRAAAINAALYGVGYLWGMTNMLIFMTFNVWVMLACGVGAAVGKFLSDDDDNEGVSGEEEKEASCH
ncbi:uncharacterized protein PG986_011633 [Apiospora aurea]|uniref:Copper transport protein n=1 Tax=Apiospora aurea TaxID=335848 RepID=A0ABR1PXP9_9PEZI